VFSALTSDEREKLDWILSVPFEDAHLTPATCLKPSSVDLLIEIGPRFVAIFNNKNVSLLRGVDFFFNT
jgi:hypothetical protein